MKRLPYPKIEDKSGERYWRSLREEGDSPEFQELLAREFPDGIAEPPDGVSRRDFFRTMGASFALAGLAACRRPDEKILPYARQPEHVIPGRPLYFATAMAWNGTALGLLVESHEGRPTKIEGNPGHPESLGAANAWAQAEILNLYDPDRSASPSQDGVERSWEEAAAALRALGTTARQNGGKGLAILTEAHRSPTTRRLLEAVKQAMPGVRIHRYEPFARDHAREGARIAFGRPLEQVAHTDRAQVILALDSDFLIHDNGSALRHARGFAAGRQALSPGEMSRLYSIESSFTVTGAMADHRLRLTSRQVSAFAVAVARELGITAGLPVPDLAPEALTLAREVVRDLRERPSQGLILVGEKQPPIIHALMMHANIALSNHDASVSYVPPFDEAPEGAASIAALAQAIRSREVTQLLILGGNPAYSAPGDTGFADLVKGLETTFHLSLHHDETSAASHWHLNRAHFLESWDDVVALDGTRSFVQPLIAPLFDGKTDGEVLSMLLGQPARAHDLVRQTAGVEASNERLWRRDLHEGVTEDSASAPFSASLTRYDVSGVAAALAPLPGLEITFVPDDHAWDGRFANNAWMQEQPANMTKLTWGNAALLSPATARELRVEEGDLLAITGAGGGRIEIPALIMPGHADHSITLTVGQGRTRAGRVGTGVGVDTSPLRTAAAFYVTGAEVKKAGGREELARTQEHFLLEEPFTGNNRKIVREGSIQQLVSDPGFVKKMEEPHPPLLSLFDDKDYSKVQKWALTIDLNTCIGCSACVTACTAENNVPVVGKRGVLLSREMHWIRIDRYFKGPTDDPTSVTQPMTCQQCENAPCETVCPVAATTHSEEGLNDMVYNRCIGTKYCLNNCPFKVRRFNYFNYTKDLPHIRRAQFNPDVTVRSRGVMEKCTYCVQRINAAKIDAHKAGKDRVADGGIKTACQQTCPTQAIQFGDLNDPESIVARLKEQQRSYVLLQEINVRPRTTYLAKIRNRKQEIA
jgi:MoCo/4Fe-4S cofactor protein with predicted Tat translocation signal